jgi:hypothetical protein
MFADVDARFGCVGTYDASSKYELAKCRCIESLTAQAELARRNLVADDERSRQYSRNEQWLRRSALAEYRAIWRRN